MLDDCGGDTLPVPDAADDGSERGDGCKHEARPHRPALRAGLQELSLHNPSLESRT